MDFYSSSSSPISLSSNPLPLSTLTFHLEIKPFIFWRKYGSKKLTTTSATKPKIQIFWDLSRAKFGSGPEPHSGFYVAVVVDGEMALLVGDCTQEAFARTKAQKQDERAQVLVLRREHVFGNRVYTTKARFGGKNREISIDCRANEDARLNVSVDGKRVLQIKRLKWKFRGNEKIDVDGVSVQISWDVYNWLFDDAKSSGNGHAVFMFRFENPDQLSPEQDDECCHAEKNGVVSWQQSSCGFGINGIEWRKMRKSLLRSGRSSSSSSISMSSASSGCSSSVMEWASTEESELSSGPIGFSLLVYAWKK